MTKRDKHILLGAAALLGAIAFIRFARPKGLAKDISEDAESYGVSAILGGLFA